MRRLLPVLAAAVSGVATALAFPTVISAFSLRPLDPRGWMELFAWGSLVPVFLVLRASRRAWPAFWLGLLSGVVFFFSAIYWVGHAMTAFGGLPLWLSLLALTLLVLYCAAHWAIAFGVAARVRERLGWPLWVVLPPIWTATELLRNHLFSGFPWANLGYTQVRTLPVAQLAALAGPYGIAALVVLVNAALAEVAAAWRERRRVPRLPPAVAGAALLLTLGWGWMHLASVRAEMATAPGLSVGVVQPNVDQSRTNSRLENEAYILQRLVPPTEEADRAGADLVVWPEAIYPGYPPSTLESFAVRGAGIPPLSRAHLVAGVYTVDRLQDASGRRRERVANMLFLVAPDLTVQGRYTKIHLVPFGEYIPAPVRTVLPFLKQVVPIADDATPGKDYTVFSFRPSTPASGVAASAEPAPVRLAPLICYDAIFPEITRTFMRKDPPPDLLVNSTNDAWYGYSSAPYQFLAIVQLRAIEARRTVIRSAVAGVSAVILPTGELAPGAIEVGPVDPDLAPDRNEPARLLLADAPRLRGRTLYTTIGDLFAYACALLAAGAWAATWRRGSIARASPSPRRRAGPASSGTERAGPNPVAR
jgi:apolipoprotein N-acyltransferase